MDQRRPTAMHETKKHTTTTKQSMFKANCKKNKMPPKVTYISNPMHLTATADQFRAVVQELTGRDSNVADLMDSLVSFQLAVEPTYAPATPAVVAGSGCSNGAAAQSAVMGGGAYDMGNMALEEFWVSHHNGDHSFGESTSYF